MQRTKMEFNTAIERLKKPQTELLKIKNSVSQIKSSVTSPTNTMNPGEDTTSGLKDKGEE